MVRRKQSVLSEGTEEALALSPEVWRPEAVDLLAGGFPCQPFSVAGDRRGEDDPRNLWPQVIATIRYLRPRFVFLENVPGLLANEYFGTILQELAEAGYDAEWGVFSAAEVGAWHQRERLFILAYAISARKQRLSTQQVSRQSGLPWSKDVRRFEDLLDRPDIPQPLIRRISNGAAQRLDSIGNAVVPATAMLAFTTLWDRMTLTTDSGP